MDVGPTGWHLKKQGRQNQPGVSSEEESLLNLPETPLCLTSPLPSAQKNWNTHAITRKFQKEADRMRWKNRKWTHVKWVYYFWPKPSLSFLDSRPGGWNLVPLSSKELQDLEGRSTPMRQNATGREIRNMTVQFPEKWAAIDWREEDGLPTLTDESSPEVCW